MKSQRRAAKLARVLQTRGLSHVLLLAADGWPVHVQQHRCAASPHGCRSAHWAQGGPEHSQGALAALRQSQFSDQQRLQDGNRRFVDGCPLANRTNSAIRKELVVQGQAPHTAIVGCADSRAPLETIFDTMPGAQLVNQCIWLQKVESSRTQRFESRQS